jgi:hypothetical protein
MFQCRRLRCQVSSFHFILDIALISGPRMDANAVINQMPPNIRQQFDAEPDNSRKGQILQAFARKVGVEIFEFNFPFLASEPATNAAITIQPI